MRDGRKEVWSIPYVSVAFFPSLKHNFVAYRSCKVSDCIFEIHQQWQPGFSRVYSNCCCSCSFESEIIKIGQSSHKIYSNNILYFQGSTTILNAHTKKSRNLLKAPHTHTHIYIYIYIYIYVLYYIILYSNGGINVIFELSWVENPANTYIRHTQHGTAVSTLLGLISSAYPDLHHWRSNEQPQNAEA